MEADCVCKCLKCIQYFLNRRFNTVYFRNPKICCYCGVFFDMEFQLNIHLADVHKLYVCDYCQEVFLQDGALLCHTIIHRIDNCYYCSLCNKKCLTYQKLMKHKYRSPLGLTCDRLKKKFKCSQCLRVFQALTGLKGHIKSVHENRQFLCHICGKAIVCDGSFRNHLASHSGIFKYKCPFCDKMMLKKVSLNLHIRTHTKVKPFVCEICGKAFTQACGKNVHKRTVHSNYKPFKCHICDKGFGFKCTLTQHLKGHVMIAASKEDWASAIYFKSFGINKIITLYWQIALFYYELSSKFYIFYLMIRPNC